MARTYRLLVSGSAKLSDWLVEFAETLGEQIIETTDLILVTGGLEKLDGAKSAVDGRVVAGALRALNGKDAAERIWTFLPQREYSKAQRFKHGKIVPVRHSGLRSRRFTMVHQSDAVITIEGHKATGEIIDLAWALQKPVLPLPFTEGNSEDRWERYKCDLISRFSMEDEAKELEQFEGDHREILESDQDGLRRSKAVELAQLALSIVQRPLKPQCFIAIKFRDHPVEDVCTTIQEIAEEVGLSAKRVDELAPLGNIVTAIWESIRTSDILIADITGYTPNVFYELGVSHALGKPTIIILHSPDGKTPSDIPFDISVEQIIAYSGKESLREKLLDVLRRIKA